MQPAAWPTQCPPVQAGICPAAPRLVAVQPAVVPQPQRESQEEAKRRLRKEIEQEKVEEQIRQRRHEEMSRQSRDIEFVLTQMQGWHEWQAQDDKWDGSDTRRDQMGWGSRSSASGACWETQGSAEWQHGFEVGRQQAIVDSCGAAQANQAELGAVKLELEHWNTLYNKFTLEGVKRFSKSMLSCQKF